MNARDHENARDGAPLDDSDNASASGTGFNLSAWALRHQQLPPTIHFEQLNEHIDLQLNVSNIFNTFYYDQVHPSHMVPGAGRTALLTVDFKY